jgi:hypothetical protein
MSLIGSSIPCQGLGPKQPCSLAAWELEIQSCCAASDSGYRPWRGCMSLSRSDRFFADRIQECRLKGIFRRLFRGKGSHPKTTRGDIRPTEGRIVGPLRYDYAMHLVRRDDGLKRLGYEVIDAKIERLSILNNCGYSIDEIEANAGRLNEFSLFETVEDARKFQRYIKTESADHHLDEAHSDGVIFEVWGGADHW